MLKTTFPVSCQKYLISLSPLVSSFNTRRIPSWISQIIAQPPFSLVLKKFGNGIICWGIFVDLRKYLILLNMCTVPWDACNHTHMCRHTHKFMCAIYHTCKIIEFSLFVLLLFYVSHKEKFFI